MYYVYIYIYAHIYHVLAVSRGDQAEHLRRRTRRRNTARPKQYDMQLITE